MIPVICDGCGQVFTACVVLGLVECPHCGGDKAHLFLGVREADESEAKERS